MGYFSAFWSSSRWPMATKMSSKRQTLLSTVNLYLQSSLKHITQMINIIIEVVVRDRFHCRMICRGVSAFVTGCPCGIWRSRFKRIVYQPMFWQFIWNELVFKFDIKQTSFPLVCIYIVTYSFSSHYLSQCWIIVNWTFRKNFSEVLIKIQNFSFTKMHLKIPSVKIIFACFVLFSALE